MSAPYAGDGGDLGRIALWVHRTIRPRAASKDAAHAAVAQAVIDYLEAKERGHRVDRPPAWILKAAVKRLGAGELSPDAPGDLAPHDCPAPAGPTEATALQELERALVRELLHRTSLSPRQRQSVLLHLDGLGAAAIAQRLDLAVRSVELALDEAAVRLLAKAAGSHFRPQIQDLVDRLLGRRRQP